jgi:hypothetical protein
MFPFLQTGLASDLQPHDKTSEPHRRIDVQRDSLEYKKMYHLNTMAVEQSYSDLDRQLAVRRQVQLATDGQVTLMIRLRRSLASILISTGQRIRPEASLGEPRYNG